MASRFVIICNFLVFTFQLAAQDFSYTFKAGLGTPTFEMKEYPRNLAAQGNSNQPCNISFQRVGYKQRGDWAFNSSAYAQYKLFDWFQVQVGLQYTFYSTYSWASKDSVIKYSVTSFCPNLGYDHSFNLHSVSLPVGVQLRLGRLLVGGSYLIPMYSKETGSARLTNGDVSTYSSNAWFFGADNRGLEVPLWEGTIGVILIDSLSYTISYLYGGDRTINHVFFNCSYSFGHNQ